MSVDQICWTMFWVVMSVLFVMITINVNSLKWMRRLLKRMRRGKGGAA